MNRFSNKYSISFVVIGKNEGWKLSKCFRSIANVVEQNQIGRYEIIYVDSCSTDDSVEIARKEANIKIFGITGKCNAAVARNIGGKEAQGDILFFLDGDMELQVDFVTSIFDQNGVMVHPVITGIYYHWLYEEKWNLIECQMSHEISEKYFQTTFGGFCAIERTLWQKMNGMDTRLTINEDYDFGIRIVQCGIHTLNIGQIAVIHHTQLFQNRKWNFYLKYRYTAFLVRKHFFSTPHWKHTLRMNYSSIILFISLIGLLFFQYAYFFYVFIVCLRSISKGIKLLPKRFCSFLIRDITFLLAFFFYHPTPILESYKEY